MKSLIAACVLVTCLFGCDARAGEDYRGEVLLRMNGSLLLERGELPANLVPALAFGAATEPKVLILDVDTRGTFPASFTIDVMSPPPAAALIDHFGLPSYAVGMITALPPDHPSELTFPQKVDGAGAFSWCENRDNTDCYRRIEQCIAGTDECYRELARCVHLPIDDMGLTKQVCDEILEQSGDPSIANFLEKFAGVSVDYTLLYLDEPIPAGHARKYLELTADGSFGAPAVVFGKEAVAAGYHLIHTRPMSDAESAAAEACGERIESAAIGRYNQAHDTAYAGLDDLMSALQAQGRSLDDPELRAVQTELILGQYDAGCLVGGVHHERIDPASAPITVTLGTRDLTPLGI